jgi:plasmid stabilization system protein ParE
MRGFRFTPQASDDLFEIWSYIAGDNIEAADRVEDAIYECCAFVAEAPLRGHVRNDLTDLPVRFWTVQRYPNYRIVYDPNTSPLQIIRVLHGARNLARLL